MASIVGVCDIKGGRPHGRGHTLAQSLCGLWREMLLCIIVFGIGGGVLNVCLRHVDNRSVQLHVSDAKVMAPVAVGARLLHPEVAERVLGHGGGPAAQLGHAVEVRIAVVLADSDPLLAVLGAFQAPRAKVVAIVVVTRLQQVTVVKAARDWWPRRESGAVGERVSG